MEKNNTPQLRTYCSLRTFCGVLLFSVAVVGRDAPKAGGGRLRDCTSHNLKFKLHRFCRHDGLNAKPKSATEIGR